MSAGISPATTGDEDFIIDLADAPSPGQALPQASSLGHLSQHEVPSQSTARLLARLERYVHWAARAETDSEHPGAKTGLVVSQEVLHTSTVSFDLSLHQGHLSFIAAPEHRHSRKNAPNLTSGNTERYKGVSHPTDHWQVMLPRARGSDSRLPDGFLGNRWTLAIQGSKVGWI